MKTKSLLLILPIILVACAHLPHTKAITGTLLPVLDRYNAYAQSNLTGDELNRALDATIAEIPARVVFQLVIFHLTYI